MNALESWSRLSIRPQIYFGIMNDTKEDPETWKIMQKYNIQEVSIASGSTGMPLVCNSS